MTTSIAENLKKVTSQLPKNTTLVAVSKTKSEDEIMQAYEAGQRIFGENKVQEMTQKWEQLPKDIQWHMIGHVQRNKVKYMAPFVSLIHGVDSLKLLKEINKQAAKHERIIDCLLQVFIAKESTKFGLDKEEVDEILTSSVVKDLKHIRIVGLMGMATFTEDETQIATEFQSLKQLFDELCQRPNTQNFNPSILSMGMSSDYNIALKNGSTMVRVGSAIFGKRNYN